MTRDDIVNDSSFWEPFDETSEDELMKFENRGRPIVILQYNQTCKYYSLAYFINGYVFDKNRENLIPHCSIIGWQWFNSFIQKTGGIF